MNVNYHEWLYKYYKGSIIALYWMLMVTNGYMSIVKDLLLCIHSAKLLQIFV
jgi:hypothetical protein